MTTQHPRTRPTLRREALDWSKLPAELRWLAEPVERYGRPNYDDHIYGYLLGLDSARQAELRALGQRWAAAMPAIDDWLSRYPMSAHPEARLVYFTGYLLGAGADAGLL